MTVAKRKKRKLKGRKIARAGHEEVAKLPRVPEANTSYWINSPNGRHEYTHQLFRFPAKFHPPIVRWALGKYGRKGSTVLDPFNGSGTVQVEALTRDISSIGIDIDPVACAIARAKTTLINPRKLESALDKIKLHLKPFAAQHSDREARPGADISEDRFRREIEGIKIPSIPNITHWFRKYVVVDLARIFDTVESVDITRNEKQFFLACAIAIIRRVSNADPDPVSGLEVTSIQAERNIRRKIRVFDVFFEKSQQAILGMEHLWNTKREAKITAHAQVIQGNVLELQTLFENSNLSDEIPLVVTSPPYCRAVEYSRRHQLEMYWLGVVENPIEHVALTHTYIGRKLVRLSDWNEQIEFGIQRLDRTINEIGKHDVNKARTVRHYFHSMEAVFEELSEVVSRKATVVCVIGDSVCCKVPIATSDFIAELAAQNFALQTRFSYALRNYYMQYGLWNGEGIKQEHVLIFKPR